MGGMITVVFVKNDAKLLRNGKRSRTWTFSATKPRASYRKQNETPVPISDAPFPISKPSFPN